MNTPQDLHQLEKKVFRTTYEDGLLDVYMGLMVASFSLLNIMSEEEATNWLYFGLFLGGMFLGMLIYFLGKKYITEPRMGQVKFGKERKRRSTKLATIMAVIIGLQVLVVVFSILLWNNPGLADQLGLSIVKQDAERLLVSTIAALFVGPSMLLIAYFTDFLRGYYIAVLMALGAFLLVWARSSIPMLVVAALIIIPGVVLFIRFLRKYPQPPQELNYGG